MARRVLTNSVVVLELTWVNADALLIGVAWSSPGPLFDSGGLGAQPSCSRRRRRSIHVLPGDLTIFCGSHKLIIDRAYSSCSRATAFPTASPAPAIAARLIRTARFQRLRIRVHPSCSFATGCCATLRPVSRGWKSRRAGRTISTLGRSRFNARPAWTVQSSSYAVAVETRGAAASASSARPVDPAT